MVAPSAERLPCHRVTDRKHTRSGAVHSSRIRFRWNTEKAIQAIIWIASEHPGIDFLHLVKVLYFAEKRHLCLYGRPVLGDTYIKMPHGPVGSVAYDLLKEHSYFVAPESAQVVEEALEIKWIQGVPLVTATGREFKLDLFSQTDIECLAHSLAEYGSMPWRELEEIVHREPAWIAAQMNGEMDYRLMIDASVPNRDKLIQHLAEVGPTIAL